MSAKMKIGWKIGETMVNANKNVKQVSSDSLEEQI